MATTSRMSMVSFIRLLQYEAAREPRDVFAPTDGPPAADGCRSRAGLHLEVYHVPFPVLILFSGCCIFSEGSRQECFAHFLGVVRGEAEGGREHTSLVPAARVIRAQAVVPGLSGLHDRVFGLR